MTFFQDIQCDEISIGLRDNKTAECRVSNYNDSTVTTFMSKANCLPAEGIR